MGSISSVARHVRPRNAARQHAVLFCSMAIAYSLNICSSMQYPIGALPPFVSSPRHGPLRSLQANCLPAPRWPRRHHRRLSYISIRLCLSGLEMNVVLYAQFTYLPLQYIQVCSASLTTRIFTIYNGIRRNPMDEGLQPQGRRVRDRRARRGRCRRWRRACAAESRRRLRHEGAVAGREQVGRPPARPGEDVGDRPCQRVDAERQRLRLPLQLRQQPDLRLSLPRRNWRLVPRQHVQRRRALLQVQLQEAYHRLRHGLLEDFKQIFCPIPRLHNEVSGRIRKS